MQSEPDVGLTEGDLDRCTVPRLSRRAFLGLSAALAALPAGCARPGRGEAAAVNDIHSKLNATRVHRVVAPRTVDDVVTTLRRARNEGQAISIAGGRHAMGGQQFGTGTVHLDMRTLDRVLALDGDRGLVEVEAGIQWPALITALGRLQPGRPRPWAIVQKQTGADRFSIGGALSANIHGRGLGLPPFAADVESFTLVDAAGELRRCSRTTEPELFRLVAGGYGLFGVVTAVTLRLTPRQKLERVVEVVPVDGLMERFEQRRREGFTFGDWQFATDPAGDLLRRGVFSCYRPVDDAVPVPEVQRELSVEDWDQLLLLSHTDKRRAFEAYAGYYLTTSGQRYWSDTSQLSVYVDDYHVTLDRRLGAGAPATEMISELYVPRLALVRFLDDLRREIISGGADLIYGTVRLIERDPDSFLAWAREPWACTVLNLHVTHTAAGRAAATANFRRLIDLARAHGGSYFLTYHRWATREQVEACYPRFAEFLRHKRRLDPTERFQSDWYRHYRAMFG